MSKKHGEVSLVIDGMKVEYLHCPLAVETRRPRFSWMLASTRRACRQSAYRLCVATSEDTALADLWDSGWVMSSQTLELIYRGRELRSTQRCYWSVHVRDEQGNETSSPLSWFEMGLLDPEDWHGEWIEVELPPDRERRLKGEFLDSEPCVLLRQEFSIGTPVVSARLYCTALGGYEAYLNGVRIGRARLAPEISAADSHVYYQVHDVTDALVAGRNALGFVVGDGYYGARFFWSELPRFAFGPGPRRLRAFLALMHEDGSRSIIPSDETWKLRASPITAASLYDGEAYDARLEEPGWNCAGLDDSDWYAVRCGTGAQPSMRLIAQSSPPIEAMETVVAVSERRIDGQTTVHDFGQNFAGLCRLHVKGEAGDRLTLRFAERLHEDGSLDVRNLRTAQATDQYILKGDVAGESWLPAFTYHGFQYVELSGKPVSEQAARIEGVVVGSNCTLTGQLRFPDSPLLQGIWDNALRSQRANFVGIPTDCPQRDERAGWLADIQVFLDAAAFNMDVNAFIRRFLNEIRATQEADGAVVTMAPLPSGTRAGVSCGWSDACVVMPWLLYQRYGDVRVIEDNWHAMERWMYYVQSVNPDGLWRHRRGWDLGDWLSVDAKGPSDETTPKLLCATAYWAYTAGMMADMADAIGNEHAAVRYRELRDHVADAFRREFIREDGTVGNGSQTSQVLALHFELLPRHLREAAVGKLADDIMKRGLHLSTGILGTAHLLDVLADHGRADVAAGLLVQTTYPSWGYMLARGATTMWERWDSDVRSDSEADNGHMNSYNHYMLGSVAGFMYRRLAGIAPAEPGFRRLSARPLFDARIATVHGHYDSAVGRIESCVRGDASGLTAFDLRIPANTLADLELPVGTWRDEHTGMLLEIAQPGKVSELASGVYAFRKVQ